MSEREEARKEAGRIEEGVRRQYELMRADSIGEYCLVAEELLKCRIVQMDKVLAAAIPLLTLAAYRAGREDVAREGIGEAR